MKDTGLKVDFKLHFEEGRHRKKKIRNDEAPPKLKPVALGTIPRISKLMALAIHFEKLIQEGLVTDYAELARLGHVTRARISQIVNLLNLAPDIQEEILFLPRVLEGKEPITEHQVREITGEADWQLQRMNWSTKNCATRNHRRSI